MYMRTYHADYNRFDSAYVFIIRTTRSYRNSRVIIFIRSWRWYLQTLDAALAQVAEKSPDPQLQESYRDVDLYLTVARSLLAVPSRRSREIPRIPSVVANDDDVQAIVKCIRNAAETGFKGVHLWWRAAR